MEKIFKNVQLATIKHCILKKKVGYINSIELKEKDSDNMYLLIEQGERTLRVEVDDNIIELIFTDNATNTIALYEFNKKENGVQEFYNKVYEILEEIHKDIELFHSMLDRDLFI